MTPPRRRISSVWHYPWRLFLLGFAGMAAAQTIPNPSFEGNSFLEFPGYAIDNGDIITGWVIGGTALPAPEGMVGLNPASGSPFADNGATPDGANVAFIQSSSGYLRTLSTTITGLRPGAVYQVTFRANARATGVVNPAPTWSLNGGAFVPFTANPPVGGANPYYTNSVTFTATNISAALVLANQTASDSAVLLDDFRIAEVPQAFTVSPWADDFSTGLLPGQTLWAFHFNSAGDTLINGVKVVGVSGVNPAVSGRFSVSGADLPFYNDTNNLTALTGSGSAVMGANFIYNGYPTTITVQGLTVNVLYTVSVFGVGFDTPGNRIVTFSGAGGQSLIDEDVFGRWNGVRVDYSFFATNTTSSFTIAPVNVGTFHLYGLALRRGPAFKLNGAAVITNECHSTYTDAGAQGNVLTIAGGYAHSLALKSDSTVVGWGYNDYGQTIIPGGLSNVVAISAGYTHSLALKSDGTVAAWGTHPSIITSVPSGLSNVVAIAAGSFHSLALKSDGTVTAWGNNVYGERTIPASLNNVIAVAGGRYYFSLALRSDGTVAAWGNNDYGQTNIPAGLSNVVAIAGGGDHGLALRSDGMVLAWGTNDSGQTSIPVDLNNVVAIAAGYSHSLALKSDGSVVAWGKNDYNQTNVPAGLSNVVAIAAGDSHSLALKSDGIVVAWGNNNYSQSIVPPNAYLSLPVSGSVNTNAPGAYSLSYNLGAGLATLNRLVTVADTLPPVITLNGSDPIIFTNTSRIFTDPGATALDLCGGAMTVNVNSTVNPNIGGTYTITYTSSDNYGNSVTNTRTVFVALPPAIPGDLNGDGVVDQSEVNTIYGYYVTNSPFLLMTNVAGLGGTNVTFALSNSPLGNFSVEYSTDLATWLPLGVSATPRYLFTDTNAPALPQRYYRLRYP